MLKDLPKNRCRMARPDGGGEDTAAEPVHAPSPSDVGEALRRCGAFVLGGGLLVALVLCIKVYWLALLWRQPSKNSN